MCIAVTINICISKGTLSLRGLVKLAYDIWPATHERQSIYSFVSNLSIFEFIKFINCKNPKKSHCISVLLIFAIKERALIQREVYHNY